jgi:hypothetical protein
MIRWTWMGDFERDAREQGDPQRVRLATLHEEAYTFRESDPDRALALYDEGRRLAQVLGEPSWVLYYQRWRVHALLHFKRDYREVIELAIRNTLEARKPRYDDLPHRLSTHEDLIAAYLGVDPVGYAEPIEEALCYLEETIPQQLGRQLFLQAMWRDFYLQRGMIEEAWSSARRSLALISEYHTHPTALHYAVFVFCGLCAIHHHHDHWQELAEASEMGVEIAREVGHKLEMAECLAWRAVSARHAGHEEAARGFLYRATTQTARLRMPPTELYFDALCAYHEMAGELEAVLEVRRRELATVEGWGRWAFECRAWLRIARLLAGLDRPAGEELARARALAARLRQPRPYLEQLERIERGQTAPDPAAPHI